MSVTFDGQNKIIQVDPGVTFIDIRTVYSRWKDWVLLSDNAKWSKAFRVTGGDPIGGGLFSPIFFFLVNGWTVRPDDTSGVHELTVSLNLYSDPDTAPRFTTVAGVTISNKTSDAAITNIDLLEYSSFQNVVTVDVTTTNTGTVFPTGTPQRPVNNIGDAILIANTRGFKAIKVLGDITLDINATLSEFTIYGESPIHSTITVDTTADVTNSIFKECSVLGTLDGGNVLENCHISTLNYINGTIQNCLLNSGTITLAGGIDANILNCWSGVIGTGSPVVNMGGGGQGLGVRNYSGGIMITNLSDSSNVSLDINSGNVILDSTVTNGNFQIRGVATLTNNSTGTTINGEGLLNRDNIFLSSAIRSGIAQGSGTGPNQIQFDASASSLNGAYDPALVFIRSGTGSGQTRLIFQYDGLTKTATVDRDWKVLPDNTSEFAILPNPGREHVNEGLAAGGSLNTITLNANASSYNDAYKYQTVFLRSGTGEDQVNLISSYNGTTKIATCHHNWAIIPDTTTGYVMLPTHIHTGSTAEVATAVWDKSASDHTTPGSMGHFLQKKLLTVAKFIGLK